MEPIRFIEKKGKKEGGAWLSLSKLLWLAYPWCLSAFRTAQDKPR